jgi:signal transduction histidine kinase/signal recognition particle receptor subunit beta
MGFINVAERTINAKLVYYGVGVGGKTTSLQQVHGILCPRNEVQLVSINTEEDSTLLFDFLPINLGQVGGFKIRIQGFTVPGQPKYRQMRKYVLQGADAVVFVVDSQRSRLQENLESLQSMRENLRTSSGTSEDIPIIVQYNKRDLPDVMGEAELDRAFRFRDDVATFPSVATEGQGVFEAFVEAASLLVERKVALYGLGRGKADPREVAEGVRQKLWAICDDVRRDRAVVPAAELPQTRLAFADGVAPGDDDDAPIELLSARRRRLPAPKAEPVDADEPFGLSYQLRDSSAGTSSAKPRELEVLSDEELQIDFSGGLSSDLAVDADATSLAPTVQLDDADPTLFHKSVQSNLELANRYGELDEKRLLLEHKVQELVEAAQQTVHDLNRPLSAMRLMLSTIDKGYLGQVSDPVRQAVQTGLQAVHQMERLVRDLLDSSRLDHDGVQLQFSDCELTLLFADVLRTLRFELQEKRVQLRVDPLPIVRADGWALTKVFLNLLGNAIAYARPGEAPWVHVFAEESEDEWRIAVADRGIGVPEADRPRLFRRFERGSNTAGTSGTGLGLHIVKELVQGHGGSVSFSSEVGQGTTFVLHLPKRPVQAPHSPTSAVAARHGL